MRHHDRDKKLVVVGSGCHLRKVKSKLEQLGHSEEAERIFVFTDEPYEALMKKCDLIVTNGGQGSMQKALRAKKPQLMCLGVRTPGDASRIAVDKMHNKDLIFSNGLGPAPSDQAYNCPNFVADVVKTLNLDAQNAVFEEDMKVRAKRVEVDENGLENAAAWVARVASFTSQQIVTMYKTLRQRFTEMKAILFTMRSAGKDWRFQKLQVNTGMWDWNTLCYDSSPGRALKDRDLQFKLGEIRDNVNAPQDDFSDKCARAWSLPRAGLSFDDTTCAASGGFQTTNHPYGQCELLEKDAGALYFRQEHPSLVEITNYAEFIIGSVTLEESMDVVPVEEDPFKRAVREYLKKVQPVLKKTHAATFKFENWGKALKSGGKRTYPYKKVYSYWGMGTVAEANAVIKACFRRLQLWHGEDFILLTPENLGRHLAPEDVVFFRAAFEEFSSHQHLTKYVLDQRLGELLKVIVLFRNGGVWIDPGIMLLEPLQWLWDDHLKNHNQIFFFRQRLPGSEQMEHPAHPLMYSARFAAAFLQPSFLAAIGPHTRFMTALLYRYVTTLLLYPAAEGYPSYPNDLTHTQQRSVGRSLVHAMLESSTANPNRLALSGMYVLDEMAKELCTGSATEQLPWLLGVVLPNFAMGFQRPELTSCDVRWDRETPATFYGLYTQSQALPTGPFGGGKQSTAEPFEFPGLPDDEVMLFARKAAAVLYNPQSVPRLLDELWFAEREVTGKGLAVTLQRMSGGRYGQEKMSASPRHFIALSTSVARLDAYDSDVVVRTRAFPRLISGLIGQEW